MTDTEIGSILGTWGGQTAPLAHERGSEMTKDAALQLAMGNGHALQPGTTKYAPELECANPGCYAAIGHRTLTGEYFTNKSITRPCHPASRYQVQ